MNQDLPWMLLGLVGLGFLFYEPVTLLKLPTSGFFFVAIVLIGIAAELLRRTRTRF